MIDWGLRDQAAALTALADLVPGTPRWVIGQSIGGLWLAFHPAMAGVERVATVGSGQIHVTDHPFGFRTKARALWQGPVPDLSRRLGFAPGRLLGFGAGLPLGVCADWRRWSLTNGFHLSDVGSSLQAPDTSLRAAEMRFVAVSDEVRVPPDAVWRMMAFHPEAMKRRLVPWPETFGLREIRHLAAFRRRNAVVWPALVD